MKDITSNDGKYWCVMQDDGNFVVYRKSDMLPLWDAWAYEKTHNIPIPIPNHPPNSNTNHNPKLIVMGCNPIGMAYWRNINNHQDKDFLTAFLAIKDEIILFDINKSDLSIRSQYPLGIHHTGEGCYFSAIRSNILFVNIDGVLNEVNIDTGIKTPIWDVSPNKLWQNHTNYYDTVHSATLRDSNYNTFDWITSDGSRYGLKGDPDECQIDKSGKWLLIKEDNYNRIVNISTGLEKVISNEAGAVGHSDCGFECAMGENDFSSLPGALDLIDYNNGQKNLYSTGIWNMGYFSFTNAKPGSLASQYGLVSTPSQLIKVYLDGSKRGEVICNNLTEDQSYNNRPKANLCPLGEYAIWTALVGGNLNAYIDKL